jgi:DNA invertase Pin-like site-specific DNA recombinase
LKTAGANFAKEQKEEKFTASHKVIERHSELFDNLAETFSNENNITISPVRQAQLDTARKMAFFYIEHPAEFDKFVMQFYFNKNQAAIARDRQVSREAISKQIRNERGDKYKREIANLKQQNAAFATMTANELKVYQICYVDGVFSASNIAKRAGISRWTVYRVLHRLSGKYGIAATLEKSRNKKN